MVRYLKGIRNIADGILINGATQTEHDIAFEALFKRLEENGLTLNKAKCEFNRDNVEFFGIVFSANGILPDEKNVHVIRETKPSGIISEAES